jgi:esterase FrsA
VGTESCFQFISELSETAYQQKISSSPIELIIGPSMGHKGHGTPPEVFKDGAAWIRRKLVEDSHG